MRWRGEEERRNRRGRDVKERRNERGMGKF